MQSSLVKQKDVILKRMVNQSGESEGSLKSNKLAKKENILRISGIIEDAPVWCSPLEQKMNSSTTDAMI